MNRLIVAVALLCSGVALSDVAVAQVAQAPGEDNNTLPGQARNIVPGSAQPTRGVVFFTAAMNSDGSIGSCFGCTTPNTKD